MTAGRYKQIPFMRTFRKLLTVIILFNAARIFTSCCECDDTPVRFTFRSIDVRNLDNKGEWAIVTASNNMAAEAVAFEVSLYDSTGYFGYAALQKAVLPGFSKAMAFTCDCSIPFQATSYPESLMIKTLYAINDSIQAGADVTSCFVARSSGNGAISGLYQSVESVFALARDKIYYDSGVETVQLFLMPEIKSDKAKFEISVRLSDGRILSGNTQTINIRQQ